MRPAEGAEAADGAVEELSSLLAAVEDQAELLAAEAQVRPDPALAEQVDELGERVARLRGTLRSLQGRTP
jgi:hypothetical protein